jgi:hypothetical protein
MVQPAEPVLRKDLNRGYRTNPAIRCPLLKSEMRAILMMVTNILREQSFQVAFVHRNDVIQQISSAVFDPTLRYTILPRAFEGCLYGAHLQRSNGLRFVKTRQRLNILHLTCYTTSLYVIDFKCALDFGEAHQDGFAASFPVGLFHPLQHAGLSRRSPVGRQFGTAVEGKNGWVCMVERGWMVPPPPRADITPWLAPKARSDCHPDL